MVTRKRAAHLLSLLKVVILNSDWSGFAEEEGLPKDVLISFTVDVVQALDVAIKDVESFDAMLNYSARK